MDDAHFARFLVSIGRLSEEAIRAVHARLAPGQRLAQRLVQEGALGAEEARSLWAHAESGGSAPSDPTLPPRPFDPGGGVAQTLSPAHEPPTIGGAPSSQGEDARLPRIGELVAGNYRLESELGRGGMGAVFRASDLRGNRQVALKLVLPGLADAVSLERFTREAQLAARVDKQGGVVRVFDFGRHEGLPYCAMELVEGRDLAQVLSEDDPLPPARLLAILIPAAETLAACHAEGIVHRDLKPANILVTRDDQAKIADFGLARDESLERLTQTGELLGTPSYMAPEQADHASQVDARSDVYALGAILYRALAGRPPFEGPVHVVVKDLLLSEPPRPSKLRPGISPDLEAVCLQAMAKDPDARYASADLLAQDLRRVQEGAPVLARPQGAWARLASRYRRGVGRTRTRVHAALVIGLAALTGAGFFGLRAVAAGRVARYQAWQKEQLEPYAYGQGTRGFAREDISRWRAELSWTDAFSSKAGPALATLAAHEDVLRFVETGELPAGPPASPQARVALAWIELERARQSPRQATRHRRRALELVEPSALGSGDPFTQRTGARLRHRLQLRDPELSLEERVRLAGRLLREEPALAEEAREAAVLTLGEAFTELLRADELDPAQVRALHTLGREACGLPVLKAAVAHALRDAAPEWTARFLRARYEERMTLLSALANVSGHGDEAVRPGPVYLETFRKATSGKDVREEQAIRLTVAIWDTVDPNYKPSLELYARLQEAFVRAEVLDLDVVLFSLRALPPESAGKFIPPSLRRSFDRLPDPGGRSAPASQRDQRFVNHFRGLTRQPRWRGSRAIRLMLLVAMRRAGYHDDPRKLPELIEVAREASTGRSASGDLQDDLADPWVAYAQIQLAGALSAIVKRADDALKDTRTSAADKAAAQERLEVARAEAMQLARSAEGRVKPQYAGSPFTHQAELLRDPKLRLPVWERAARVLRAGLANAVENEQYVTYHYEESLGIILRRWARDLLDLRDRDQAYARAAESATLARKASSLKKNQSLDRALAVMARVRREQERLDEAEAVIQERIEVGLQTPDFALVAAQIARDRGDLTEAMRRAREGAKLSDSSYLADYLAELQAEARRQE